MWPRLPPAHSPRRVSWGPRAIAFAAAPAGEAFEGRASRWGARSHMRPCSPIVSACPRGGLSRYWYGLPPWPAAQWAWRRQFLAPCSSAAVGRRLDGIPAYLLSLNCPPPEATEVRVVAVAASADAGRHTRLWPFRWPLEIQPLDDVSPPPPAIDPQAGGSLSIII